MNIGRTHPTNLPSIGELINERLCNPSLTSLEVLVKGHLLCAWPDVLCRFSAEGQAPTRHEPRPSRVIGTIQFHVRMLKTRERFRIKIDRKSNEVGTNTAKK